MGRIDTFFAGALAQITRPGAQGLQMLYRGQRLGQLALHGGTLVRGRILNALLRIINGLSQVRGGFIEIFY